MSFRVSALSTLAVSVAFVGCASTPPNVQRISNAANPTTEIEKTEEMMTEARTRQVDVLSPENYADAEKSLKKAKSQRDDGKENEKILENVANARAWLGEANKKAEIAQLQMTEITDARAGAVRAGAPNLLSKEWKSAEKKLEGVTASIEKGNLKPSNKEGQQIIGIYRNLERQAVARTHLASADDNFKVARNEGAHKKAPKTYEVADLKYQNVMKLIEADPRNTPAIAKAAQDATRESRHLVDVTKKVNAGNTEALVLQAERQERTITNLRDEYNSTEEALQNTQSTAESQRAIMQKNQQELARQQELLATAASIRSQFKPAEAEVYTENNRLMVRLKGLQFPSNQAALGPKNQALLKRVESALANVDTSKVTIEGHTDSTGNADANRILSEKRATAVADYFVKNGALTEDKVEAVGMGTENPISDNSTQQGRAQNRRIDLVIETQ